jgi:hypothetical protein
VSPGLDHMAVLHHNQTVGQQTHHGKVMGDHDRGQAHAPHEAANQVEKAGLHADVETRRSVHP